MRAKAVHVANLIRTKRRQLDLSQAALNDVIFGSGKCGQFISNIERGKCGLPSRYARKTAEALQISVDEIIEATVADYKENLSREVLNGSHTLSSEATA